MGIEEAFALKDQHAELLNTIKTSVAGSVLAGEITREAASVKARQLFERHLTITAQVIGHTAVPQEIIEQPVYPQFNVTTALLTR